MEWSLRTRCQGRDASFFIHSRLNVKLRPKRAVKVSLDSRNAEDYPKQLLEPAKLL